MKLGISLSDYQKVICVVLWTFYSLFTALMSMFKLCHFSFWNELGKMNWLGLGLDTVLSITSTTFVYIPSVVVAAVVLVSSNCGSVAMVINSQPDPSINVETEAAS